MVLAVDNRDSDAICESVKARNGTVLLACSLGKDSVAAWFQLRRHGFKVVPYFCYLVPGLAFVQRAVEYYEEFFGEKILQLPHPSLHRWINNMVFQPPERCATIEASSLTTFNRDQMHIALKESLGLPETTLTASGVRACDSTMRYTHFKTHGAINERGRMFYPIWDWNIARLKQEMVDAGVKLPVDYWMFGRSFDGLDYRFLSPIKKHHPKDWKKILEWFPLAELEIKREEFANAKY